jgi:hypothetical protein
MLFCRALAPLGEIRSAVSEGRGEHEMMGTVATAVLASSAATSSQQQVAPALGDLAALRLGGTRRGKWRLNARVLV